MTDRYRLLIIIVVWSTLLIAAVFFVAVETEQNYLIHNAYFFDPIYYASYNVELATRVADEGRWAVAVDEWLHNGRHPLRTIPLVLLAPSLLTHRFGYLATFVPALWLFLILLGWTVYHRTRSLSYVLAIMAVACVVPIYYHVNRGIATYWLEWSAAFFIGCAALSLVNAVRTHADRWLILFACSTAGATLSRYIAIAFVAWACLPWIIYFLWKRKRIKRSLGIVAGCIAFFAGYYLIVHFSDNLHFYSTYGYALDQTITASWQFIWGSFFSFLAIPGRLKHVFIVVLLLVMSFALWRGNWKDWPELCFMAWLPLSIPLLLIALGTVGAAHPLVYTFPLLVFAIATPLPWKERAYLSRTWCVAGVIACISAALLTQYYLQGHILRQQRDSPEKIFNIRLTRMLNNISGSHVVWQGYFDEYTTIPTMELYYSTNRLFLPAGQAYFHSQRVAWEGDHPGLTPQQVAERVYAASKDWVDLVVVFGSTDQVRQSTWLNNEYTRTVAAYMSETVQTDPQWNIVFDLNDDTYYGRLVGYRNTATRPDRYEAVLHHLPETLPNRY